MSDYLAIGVETLHQLVARRMLVILVRPLPVTNQYKLFYPTI